MGTDVNDTLAQRGFPVMAQHLADGHPILDVIAPSVGWAMRIVPEWGRFVASLGFSGIHWDTLGGTYDESTEGVDIPGFLRAARPVLQEHGLAQTCNFVDGYGWDASLLVDVGWHGNIVAFPYWETWSIPVQEDRYFKEVTPRGRGVFVCYPGKSSSHAGEDWNSGTVGTWPLDLIIQRWHKARCFGSAYLAIGDGTNHIQNEYFPDTVSINEADIHKIRSSVFSRSCSTSFETCCPSQHHTWTTWQFWLICIMNILFVLTIGALVKRIYLPGDSECLLGMFGQRSDQRRASPVNSPRCAAVE